MGTDKNSQLWALYQGCRQGLYSYALSITGQGPEAEDAVHGAVVAVAHVQGPVRDLRAYLFRAVRNEALEIQRARRRGPPLEDVQAGLIFAEGGQPGPDQECLRKEEQASLVAALRRLPAQQQEVIVLRVYSDLRFRQIAAVLEEPLPTVTTRYRRAIQALGEMLKEQNDASQRDKPAAQAYGSGPTSGAPRSPDRG